MKNILKFFVLVNFFFAFNSGISNAQNPSQNTNNQAEVDEITKVAVAFMKAYSKDDQTAVAPFISSNSEFKNKPKQQIWNQWQGRKNLVFDRAVKQFITINDESALVRITFDLRETDSDGEENLNPYSIDFTVVKEKNIWKILDAGKSARLLAEKLQAAESEQTLLEIIRNEKAFLNSFEFNDVLSHLQNNIKQDNNRIFRIFEILLPQIEKPKYKVIIFFEQGWLLEKIGNSERAEQKFSESIILSRKLNDDISYAQSLISLGAVYLHMKKDVEAADMINKGLDILLGKPNLLNEQLSWLRYAGNFYSNEEEYQKAHNYYEQGEKLAEKNNQIPLLAFFIKDLGDCDYNAKKYIEALRQYQKLATILERPEEKEGFFQGTERINLPLTYSNVANTLEKLNRNSEAQSLFEKSCNLTDAINNPQDIKYTCNSLIEFYFRNNSDQKAIESFNKLSEKLFELKAETELIDQIKDFVAIIALEKGRHNQAEEIVEYWSEKISAEKRKDIYQIQMILYLTNYKWNLVQAIGKKIIDSEYSTNEDKYIASISLATTYAQYQREEGLRWIKKAELFADQTNDKEAITFARIFEIGFLLEDDQETQNIKKLEKFIQENSDNDILVATASYYLGINYFLLAETENAYKVDSELVKNGIGALQKSIEIYNRPEYKDLKSSAISIYLILAENYKELRDFQSALENIKKAKEIATETEEMNFIQGQLNLIEAEIQYAIGDFVKAKENFEKGLQGLDMQSQYVSGGIQGQLNFTATYHSIFQNAVNAELKTSNIDTAIAVVDLAKGRVLGKLTQDDNKKPDWRFADGALKGINTTTIIKRNDKSGEKNLLSKSNKSVEQESNEIKSLNLSEDTAILDYFVDDDNIHLFILTSKTKAASQVSAKNKESNQLSNWQHYIFKYDYLIEEKVRSFQNLLRNDKSHYRQTAKELYDLLLKPVEKQIDGKSTLIIIPDSFLWQVPFQALVTKNSANPNNENQEKFVIEKFAVQYEYSLSHLIKSQQRKQDRANQQSKVGTKDVLAIGNSTFGEQVITLKSVPEVFSPFEDKPKKFESIIQNGVFRKNIPERRIRLQPLPGAVIEARNLIKIYGINKLDYWIDGNASKNKFIEQASSYKIIHVATHGILDDKNPLNSSLVFSNSVLQGQNAIAGKNRKSAVIKQTSEPSLYGEEFLLTAQEISSNLRLNADLVILSACDTANGEVSDGEGLIGLTWAFLGAGATDVVASLWTVDDGKTPELMKDFHQKLQDKKQTNSIPVALQKSIKGLLQNPDYYHPYYWAGFVSIGAS